MTSLQQIQKALQAHLLNNDMAIKAHINRPQNGKLTQRLAIYADAYRARLISAMKQEFSLLVQWLKEDFITLIETYIDQNPSRFISIAQVGQDLPKFLQRNPDHQKPYLAELAELILMFNQAWAQISESAFLTQSELIEIPQQDWPRIIFTLNPSIQFIHLNWNTLSIYNALQKQQKVPKPKMDKKICMIWRKEQLPYYWVLSEAEHFVFRSFQERLDFSEICEQLHNGLDQPQAPWLVSLIARSIQEQLLIRPLKFS
jgi:Putative DNA-binding domain